MPISCMRNKRNRTPSEHIGHGLYLYFLGLSLRNVARALSCLHIVKRSHVAVWKWIQKYRPEERRDQGKGFQNMLWMRPLSRQVRNCVALGCHRAKRQADSRIVSLQGKKHVCCGEVYLRFGQDPRKVSGFH